MEFEPGEKVLLRVSLTKGVMRLGKKGKLSPKFIGPYEILERVGEVAYRLALPPRIRTSAPCFSTFLSYASISTTPRMCYSQKFFILMITFHM